MMLWRPLKLEISETNISTFTEINFSILNEPRPECKTLRFMSQIVLTIPNPIAMMRSLEAMSIFRMRHRLNIGTKMLEVMKFTIKTVDYSAPEFLYNASNQKQSCTKTPDMIV